MKKNSKKVAAKPTSNNNSKPTDKNLIFGQFDASDAVGEMAKLLESGNPVKRTVLEKIAKQHKVDAMGRIYRLSRFVRMQKIGHLEISSDAVRLVKGKGKKVA